MTDIRARLAEALREHRAVIKHRRYWIASCSGCKWVCPQPFGFKASAQTAHEEHLVEVLLSLSGIVVVDVESAVEMQIRDGQWNLMFANGRTASAPVDRPAALLTAHLVDGDHVTVETRIA